MFDPCFNPVHIFGAAEIVWLEQDFIQVVL